MAHLEALPKLPAKMTVEDNKFDPVMLMEHVKRGSLVAKRLYTASDHFITTLLLFESRADDDRVVTELVACLCLKHIVPRFPPDLVELIKAMINRSLN
jgi:hypothetical protein